MRLADTEMTQPEAGGPSNEGMVELSEVAEELVHLRRDEWGVLGGEDRIQQEE